MRIALVYDRSGKRILQSPEGGPRAFPIFRWYHWVRHPKGWELHLLAMCAATTEDFKFQVFQGVLALGRNTNRANWENWFGYWLDLSFDRFSLHLGGIYA